MRSLTPGQKTNSNSSVPTLKKEASPTNTNNAQTAPQRSTPVPDNSAQPSAANFLKTQEQLAREARAAAAKHEANNQSQVSNSFSTTRR